MKREELFHRPVECLFDILGEITGGQLVLAPVISHTFTTKTLARAGIVRTITTLLVGFDLTFHNWQGPLTNYRGSRI
jgi:hypothetical protein